MVLPSITNTTSSAMLVARSATRSRLRLTRNKSMAAPMTCGSSIMCVSRMRNTEWCSASTESSRGPDDVRVFHHVREQDAEYGVVQRVDGVVAPADVAPQRRVAPHEGVERAREHRPRLTGH